MVCYCFSPPQEATGAAITNILSTSLWIESSLIFSIITPKQTVNLQTKQHLVCRRSKTAFDAGVMTGCLQKMIRIVDKCNAGNDSQHGRLSF